MEKYYRYQPETIDEIEKLYETSPRTMADQSMKLGETNHEPLLVCMDSMLRYAKAYKQHFGDTIGEDYVLGDEFSKVISGIRGLLNGDGAVAYEKNITTDSKDNGVIEALYWKVCEIGKINGENI